MTRSILYLTFYMKRKHQESMVKTYFTQGVYQYFLEERRSTFDLPVPLKNAVGADPGKEKIPTIYLLALTRYYAGTGRVTADEKKQLPRS